MRGLGIPLRLEERVREVLVAHRRTHLGRRREHERGREGGTVPRQNLLIEIGQRHDEADVVLGDEAGEGGNVAGVGDARNERHVIRVVERGSEPVEVRWRSSWRRPAERGHDVDALPGAGEENGSHGGRA